VFQARRQRVDVACRVDFDVGGETIVTRHADVVAERVDLPELRAGLDAIHVAAVAVDRVAVVADLIEPQDAIATDRCRAYVRAVVRVVAVRSVVADLTRAEELVAAVRVAQVAFAVAVGVVEV
jgi:hypothetical protein